MKILRSLKPFSRILYILSAGLAARKDSGTHPIEMSDSIDMHPSLPGTAGGSNCADCYVQIYQD